MAKYDYELEDSLNGSLIGARDKDSCVGEVIAFVLVVLVVVGVWFV